MDVKNRPIVLLIRDGWGANPHPEWNHANAVHLADTPVNDRLIGTCPHTRIVTHGVDVGLPEGIMGNSEVGHQNIGAGRIVDQELLLISKKVREGRLHENDVFKSLLDRARSTGGSLHLIGLCSDAGVHSSLEHLYGLIACAARAGFPPDRVFLHAISDGRDTAPFSGLELIRSIQGELGRIGAGRVVSVIGRYYAMDRDNRWDRTERAYRLLTAGEGDRVETAEAAFQHYYDHPTEATLNGDEFITPTVIAKSGEAPITIKSGDSVVFFNFRGDRPRQLVKAFCLDTFPFEDKGVRQGFDRGPKLDLCFATLSSYEQGLPVQVIIPRPPKMESIFGEYISGCGLRQFRCAETEKYPHVTFFFNDYREAPFDGEDREIVPSPRDVATYDLKPEMSAPGVTDRVVSRIQSGRYDVFVVNFANGDMVGHTGNLEAAIKAVETVDRGVGRIVDAALAAGGSLLITADHGNCEQMIDPVSGQPHTAHTTYEVDLILVGQALTDVRLRHGRLADIAPTMLEVLGLDQPAAMTGRSLIMHD